MNIFEKIKLFCFGSDQEPEATRDSKVVDYLGSLKLADLKAQAKARGLKGYSRLKKADLLALLREKQYF